MTSETDGADLSATEDTSPAAEQAQDQAPADQQQDQDPGEDPAAQADSGEGQQPDKPKSAQDRINELTWKRREAEREAEYWRTKALQSDRQPEPDPQPAGDGRPDPNNYEYGAADERYIEDLAGFRANQIVDERFAQHEARQRTTQALGSFETRAKTAFPDGEPEGLQAFRRIPELPVAVSEVVLNSEAGPKIAEHLGKNTNELRRLSAMPPHLQAYELGNLAARLSGPPPRKTVSDAPDPPDLTARGAGGRFAPAADTGDFAAFEKMADGVIKAR